MITIENGHFPSKQDFHSRGTTGARYIDDTSSRGTTGAHYIDDTSSRGTQRVKSTNVSFCYRKSYW